MEVQLAKGNEFDITATPDGKISGPVSFNVDRSDVVELIQIADQVVTVRAKADGVEGQVAIVTGAATTPSGNTVVGDQQFEVIIPVTEPEATKLVMTASEVRPIP